MSEQRQPVALSPAEQDQSPAIVASAQRTLGHAISCVGVGRHSGARVGLTLHPAPVDSGVRFRRSDRPGAATLLACPQNLVIAEHALVLADGEGNRIVGVEQVMAALAMTGVDNALIEVGGCELPAMDGSAQPFVFLIECAGTVAQSASRPTTVVSRACMVERGSAMARIEPADSPELVASIDNDRLGWSGPDRHHVPLELDALRHELAAARQPLAIQELEAAQERGLMRGVSMDNTLLLDGEDPGVRNPGGLRNPDEPARAANLLALGALALLGGLPSVRLTVEAGGHALLARLLRRCVRNETNSAEALVPAGLQLNERAL